MGDETSVKSSSDSITLSKDMLYGVIIVFLAGLLVVSVFTQGFGIVAADCPLATCPNETVNDTVVVQPDMPEPDEPVIQPLQQLTVAVGSHPALGDGNAPITMVEFSEFQCPYCARLYVQTETPLVSNYVDAGKLKIYFRDFPLPPQYHPQAGIAAMAAACADEQGKFWEMHHKLFENQGEWSGSADAESIFKGYAAGLGLDNASFNSCYGNQTYAEQITADLVEGQSYGVGGTPNSFLIIPKSMISEEDARAVVTAINTEQGGSLQLFEDGSSYTVLIPGAYPYEVFDRVLSAAS